MEVFCFVVLWIVRFGILVRFVLWAFLGGRTVGVVHTLFVLQK